MKTVYENKTIDIESCEKIKHPWNNVIVKILSVYLKYSILQITIYNFFLKICQFDHSINFCSSYVDDYDD